MELNKEHIFQIQTIDLQMKQIEQALQQVDEQIAEMQGTLKHIDEFSKLKKGDELLVSVINGVFAKATLLGSESVLVNVGSNTVVEKSIEDVKILILKQHAEMAAYKEKLVMQFNELVEQAQKLDASLTPGDG
ncbi:MAG: prefoldin subunit alpha [archaeon]